MDLGLALPWLPRNGRAGSDADAARPLPGLAGSGIGRHTGLPSTLAKHTLDLVNEVVEIPVVRAVPPVGLLHGGIGSFEFGEQRTERRRRGGQVLEGNIVNPGRSLGLIHDRADPGASEAAHLVAGRLRELRLRAEGRWIALEGKSDLATRAREIGRIFTNVGKALGSGHGL